MRIQKQLTPIRSVADWFRVAPPASPEMHWVAGRSALELARAWFPADGDAVVPAEISALFAACDFRPVAFDEGEPEALVQFDDIPRPRHTDLAIRATCARGPLAISVEAKADEAFDRLVRERLAGVEATPSSELPRRVRLLAEGLFGLPDPAPILDLRYQLLYGTAAAMAFAQRVEAATAVFLIHEFKTDKTRDEQHLANARDLDAFVSRLSAGKITNVPGGGIVGPITAPGNRFLRGNTELFFAKACRNTRGAGYAK